MALNEINNGKPQSIDEYKELAQNVNVKNEQDVINNVSIFKKGATDALEEIEPDGIDKKEISVLKDWINIINTYLNKVSDSLKEKCKTAIGELQDLRITLINKKFDAEDSLIAQEEQVNTLEPTETDSQNEIQTQIKNGKANKRLGQYIQDMKNFKKNQNADIAYNGYTNLSNKDEESIIEYAAQDIAKIFIGQVRPKISDTENLKKWADFQYNHDNIDNRLHSKLIKYADKAAEQLQIAANSTNNQTDSEEVDEFSSGESFWSNLESIMKKEGHSHNAVEDLMVMGYTKEQAEEILKKRN